MNDLRARPLDRRQFANALSSAPPAPWSQAAPRAPPTIPSNLLYMQLKDGTVVIRLRPDLAPKHVAQIKALVQRGFFNGIVFHRVIDGFMAQTGDPDRHRHGRLRPAQPSRRILQGAFQARHARHGALAIAQFRQFAILHLLRRRRLSSTANTPSSAK